MSVKVPSFDLTVDRGAFQVRDYPALIAAEVSVAGDRDAAANSGFRLLAGYIFGGNTRRERIAMTAPVVQEAAVGETIAMTAPVLQTGAGDTWIVRFVMPAGSTLETLPTPNDPRVRLVALAPARFAVIRFSGLARPRDVARETQALTELVEGRGLRAIGSPSLARYNPPWTPWFMRRNEIWIPLQVEVAHALETVS